MIRLKPNHDSPRRSLIKIMFKGKNFKFLFSYFKNNNS